MYKCVHVSVWQGGLTEAESFLAWGEQSAFQKHEHLYSKHIFDINIIPGEEKGGGGSLREWGT